MIDDDRETLRSIAWSELLPWLLLFRCFRISVRLRPLVVCAAAAVLTVVGWALIATVFSANAKVAAQVADYNGCCWNSLASVAEPAAETAPFRGHLRPGRAWLPRSETSIAARDRNPVLGSWEHLSRTFRQIYTMNADEARASTLAYSLLCGLWGLFVWAFAGAAVTRDAALQLAAGQRSDWAAILAHARRRWRAYFWAPLMPLIGILMAVACMALLGIIMRLNLGVLLAGALWPMLLVAGLLSALLLVGLLFGWPLMFATIGTEYTDSFDALSRTYAYVFQRPLHYLFYIAVAAAVGALGWLLVSGVAQAVVAITLWATSLGSGGEFRLVGEPMPHLVYHFSNGAPAAHLGWLGDLLIRFWCDCARLVAVGYLYSYFWVSAAAIYLLLRRNVDDTELDEVHLDEEGSETFGLPEISTDEAGAPVVGDQPPENGG